MDSDDFLTKKEEMHSEELGAPETKWIRKEHSDLEILSNLGASSNFAAPYPEIRNTIVVYFLVQLLYSFETFLLRIRALSAKSASILELVEQAFWRMPLVTEWSGASSFEVIREGQ